ncbi:MAG TPA: hypothetical protein VEQ63_14710 [Bryobacteraceae bacterium]|nr:hypothetical protein [Bryobacteraceae bacterium]
MSCPFFMPMQCAGPEVVRPARTPLGELWVGQCAADNKAPATGEACNFGYARQSCSRFPVDAEADAHRFASIGTRTVYVIEKAYMPIAHGDCGSISGNPALSAQAAAFAWGHR